MCLLLFVQEVGEENGISLCPTPLPDEREGPDIRLEMEKETMTVMSQGNPPGARDLVVHDEMGPLPFVGEMIADLSWSYDEARESGHQRWTDITLYRVLEESEIKYLIQVVGRSVYYHDVSGPCRKGVRVEVGVLAQDEARYDALVPCRDCNPKDLDDLGDNVTIVVEENLYTLYRCKTADEVVNVLYHRGSQAQKSNLSMKLLRSASTLDEGINHALMKMRRL